MLKKIFLMLLFGVGGLGLVSCAGQTPWWNHGEYEYVENKPLPPMSNVEVVAEDPSYTAAVLNKRVPPLNTVLVCRNKQCAPSELSMSKEYIYNSLRQLIDNNLDSTALLCEANPQAHVCINPYISVPAKVGVTPAYVFFDGVKLIDGSAENGETAFSLTLGYNLSYNGQTPTVCKPDSSLLYVKDNNEIVLNGKGFKCDMTSIGTTTIRVLFTIDYIDLDYGYIGGYYSIGLSGPAYGGGAGYGLIRLPKDVGVLSPVLSTAKPEPKQEPAPEKPKVTAAPVPVAVPCVQVPCVPVRQPVVYQVPVSTQGFGTNAVDIKTEMR